MTSDSLDELEFESRDDWRDWLSVNHRTSDGVWLVRYKNATSIPSVKHSHAVEEALCYGWVDSKIERVDESRYRLRFSRRLKKSNWSDINLRRARRLILDGKMAESGRKSLQRWLNEHPSDAEDEECQSEGEGVSLALTGSKRSHPVEDGEGDFEDASPRKRRRRYRMPRDRGPKKVVRRPPVPMPVELSKALASNSVAQANFESFAPGYQNTYCIIVSKAKLPATRQKRANRVVELCERGVKKFSYHG